jgi:hypothetical protein
VLAATALLARDDDQGFFRFFHPAICLSDRRLRRGFARTRSGPVCLFCPG